MTYYYDPAGDRIDRETWAAKIELRRYEVVLQEHIDGWFVSTVWLGIDHNFGFIFETKIFPPDPETGEAHPDLDRWHDHCSTERAARDAHDRAKAMVRGALAGAS